MAKSKSGQAVLSEVATRGDLQAILGDMDDETAVSILALRPTIAQIEEARLWLDGGNGTVGQEHHLLDVVVAQILDLAAVEEEPPPVER
jgi:hypothetical protein